MGFGRGARTAKRWLGVTDRGILDQLSCKMKSGLSIRALAKKLGISHTAVSLALRNHPSIPLPTRERVQAAAARAGYRPNATLSMLMAHVRTMRARPAHATLGFVTAWPTRYGWKAAPNLRRFYEGALQRAHELGYALDEFWLAEPGMTSERMTRILLTRGIAGLILQSLPNAGGALHLGWEYFASVTKGLTVSEPRMHRVISSHYEDMQLVLHELESRGYRRIGLVLSEALSARVDRAWLAAYLLHQNEAPRHDRLPALITRTDEEEQHFSEWLEKHRPEVVLYSAQPIPDWCRRQKLRVPRDIGLVHLDWSPSDAPLAGLNSNTEAVGEAVVELLVGQLHANEFGVPKREKIVSVRGSWVPGQSVRQVTKQETAGRFTGK